jgi:peptidoglycan L-alanyl-D-glutamate endopeptidase CwlK
MAKFGRKSRERLETCHEDLQDLFNEVVRFFDCSVLEGHRGEELQNKYYKQGNSKVKYPNGRHNKLPSNAVDVVPYPVDWDDTDRMYYFAGFVKGLAYSMGIPIRWGGDWNDNTEVKDTNFKDLPHFELKDSV